MYPIGHHRQHGGPIVVPSIRTGESMKFSMVPVDPFRVFILRAGKQRTMSIRPPPANLSKHYLDLTGNDVFPRRLVIYSLSPFSLSHLRKKHSSVNALPAFWQTLTW